MNIWYYLFWGRGVLKISLTSLARFETISWPLLFRVLRWTSHMSPRLCVTYNKIISWRGLMGCRWSSFNMKPEHLEIMWNMIALRFYVISNGTLTSCSGNGSTAINRTKTLNPWWTVPVEVSSPSAENAKNDCVTNYVIRDAFISVHAFRSKAVRKSLGESSWTVNGKMTVAENKKFQRNLKKVRYVVKFPRNRLDAGYVAKRKARSFWSAA